jgi:hypothetical protein
MKHLISAIVSFALILFATLASAAEVRSTQGPFDAD